MKKFFLLLAAFVCVTCIAQKAFKPVTTALKAKNYKEALQQISKLRKDSLYKDDVKLCVYAVEAQRGLNDAENMKIYLKQTYDTLSFFSTTYEVVKEAIRLDSIEKEKFKAEDKKPKQTKFVVENLHRYYPNIQAAVRFFYKKNNAEETMKYARMYLDVPGTEIGKSAALTPKSVESNAAMYLVSAFENKNYAEVHRYESKARNSQFFHFKVIDDLAYTAQAENDSIAYVNLLTEGWNEYPDSRTFFLRLADFYNQQGNYQKVICLSEKQLAHDSTDITAYFAQCMAHFNKKDYKACIRSAKNMLSTDSVNADAHYYIGASLIGEIDAMAVPNKASSAMYRKFLAEQQQFYIKAEKELETFRSLAPQAKLQWAPLLYKVYLALNRGKKFAEIEQLMEQ